MFEKVKKKRIIAMEKNLDLFHLNNYNVSISTGSQLNKRIKMSTKHEKGKYTDDYRLVQSTLCGIELAWDILYKNSYNIVRGYVEKLCRNTSALWESPEDVINEAFRIGYIKLDTYNGNSKFSTWICAIAKYIMFNNYRKFCRNVELIRQIGCSYVDRKHIDPGHIAIINERNLCVRYAFYSLPIKHQDIIRYIVLMDMSRRKTAERLGMSIYKCAKEYSAALESMKEKFIYMYYCRGYLKQYKRRKQNRS